MASGGVILMVATIGLYRYVAAFNNAFDVDLVEGDDQLLARRGPQ